MRADALHVTNGDASVGGAPPYETVTGLRPKQTRPAWSP
jgi:hypothetical protein